MFSPSLLLKIIAGSYRDRTNFGMLTPLNSSACLSMKTFFTMLDAIAKSLLGAPSMFSTCGSRPIVTAVGERPLRKAATARCRFFCPASIRLSCMARGITRGNLRRPFENIGCASRSKALASSSRYMGVSLSHTGLSARRA